MKHIDTAFAGLTALCCNPSDGCACGVPSAFFEVTPMSRPASFPP